MAKPIKETPFLFGEDADKFLTENKDVKKVSEKERKEINEDYETLLKVAELEFN